MFSNPHFSLNLFANNELNQMMMKRSILIFVISLSAITASCQSLNLSFFERLLISKSYVDFKSQLEKAGFKFYKTNHNGSRRDPVHVYGLNPIINNESDMWIEIKENRGKIERLFIAHYRPKVHARIKADISNKHYRLIDKKTLGQELVKCFRRNGLIIELGYTRSEEPSGKYYYTYHYTIYHE